MSNNSRGLGEGQVRIKLKKGAWEVEIVCSEDQVKAAVEAVLEGIKGAEPGEALGETKPERTKKVGSCRDNIVSLWSEGWFSSWRSLGEVHEELARRGYHYDKTAVAHSLMDLVRENLLTREGEPRSYRYAQKRPPYP